ncbi:MAG: hypothetical protein M1820_000298 [Bogoriella megaspora]|nr:MAG: hypothetical protein M1820_000298 [Bogoriella megaspora]
MGRTSKFSFPVPGQSQEALNRQVAPDLSLLKDPNDRIKAERLLGLGRVPFQDLFDFKTGTMSIAVSESSVDELESRPSKAKRPKRNLARLTSKASSNALGEKYDRTTHAMVTNGTSRTTQDHGSSSTLRSHYEAHRSPLLVSQQTSDSSVRDMALRKDISGPRQEPIPSAPRPKIQITPDNANKLKTSNQPKPKRPSRLDISKYLPRPKPNQENLLSPSQLIQSPPELGHHPDCLPSPAPSSTSKSSRWGLRSKKSKESIRTTASRSTTTTTSSSRFDNPKTNVKRPPRGIQHWFEAVDIDDDEEETDEQTANDSTQRFVRGASGANFENNGTTNSFPRHGQGTLRARQGTASSDKAKDSTLTNTNLRNQSVLSLSSDEEEAQIGNRSTRPTYEVHEHGEPDSAVGYPPEHNAAPVRVYKPKTFAPRRNLEALRHSGLTSGSIPIAPPTNYPVYNHSGADRQRRSKNSFTGLASSLPEGESIPEISLPNETSDSRAATPTQATSPTTTVSFSNELRYPPQSARMMAVTKEEEALLAMMRRKRAAMAKDSFSEGYRQALLEEQVMLEEEAAEKRRQSLLAMQARQRGERPHTARHRRQSRSTLRSSTTSTDRPASSRVPDVPELMDTSISSPNPHHHQTDSHSSQRSLSSSHGHSFPLRTSSRHPSGPQDPVPSSTHTLSRQSSSISTIPSVSNYRVSTIPIESPSLHLFPSPNSSSTVLDLNQNPLNSILERYHSDMRSHSSHSPSCSTSPSQSRSHSTTTATTDTTDTDSPLTPSQSETLPLSSSRQRRRRSSATRDREIKEDTAATVADMHRCSTSTVRQSSVLTTKTNQSVEVLPIFVDTPPRSSGKSAVRVVGKKDGERERDMEMSRREEVVSVQSVNSLQSMQSANSVQSFSSVGADVLAAWGALGGRMEV